MDWTALGFDFQFLFPFFLFLCSCSFIENYGTHIVTSVTIGGRDVVYIRQHQSSLLSVKDIEDYVKEIGDQRFLDSSSHLNAGPLKYKDKVISCYYFLDFVRLKLLSDLNVLYLLLLLRWKHHSTFSLLLTYCIEIFFLVLYCGKICNWKIIAVGCYSHF